MVQLADGKPDLEIVTLFRTRAEFLDKIENTRKRTQIIEDTANLKILEPEELEPVVSMILGRAFPNRRFSFKGNYGFQVLDKPLEAVARTSISGSREKKERLIEVLFRQASPIEAKYHTRVFLGEMRPGLHEGLTERAIAKAFNVPLTMVQRASMTLGDTGEVAELAKIDGLKALTRLKFRVLRPVKLMLA